jgi:hypothetical protein
VWKTVDVQKPVAAVVDCEKKKQLDQNSGTLGWRISQDWSWTQCRYEYKLQTIP